MLLSEKIQANLLLRKAAETAKPVKPAPKRRGSAKRGQLSPADPFLAPTTPALDGLWDFIAYAATTNGYGRKSNGAFILSLVFGTLFTFAGLFFLGAAGLLPASWVMPVLTGLGIWWGNR